MSARSCPSGKVRYRDQIGARIALASTRAGRGARRHEARAYRCPECHGWHLTSHPRREGQR